MKHNSSLSYMGKGIMTFSDTEIEKHKFQCYKNAIFQKMQTLITYQISSGEENYNYFIGYWYDDYRGHYI